MNTRQWKHGTNDAVTRYRELVAPLTEFEIVVIRLAEGETLKEICHAMGFPFGRTLYWIISDDWRYSCYTRALAEGIRSRIDSKPRQTEQPPI